MPDFPKKLTQKIAKRAIDNALRKLPIQNNLVDFSSNDYLGFSRLPWIEERAQEILLESNNFKNGATGSRLLSGNHVFCQNLEEELTFFHDCEAALIFNSGYDANLGFFASVPQRGDFIFYDEFAHASIRDGIQLSNAKSYKFKHNNLSDLKKRILLSIQNDETTSDVEVYIVTESVFSMDGDSPNLKEMANFCIDNNYRLVVDEAHATGVFGKGKGLCVEQEIQKQIFARISTFSKAVGSHGAAIFGSFQLKQYLVNFARSFIYTTALSPHSIAINMVAYDLLSSKTGKTNRESLFENITYFKQELKVRGLQDHFIESDSAIQCMAISGNQKVKTISENLRTKGFDVKPILSPTVPEGQERLRFCIHSFNKEDDIKKVVQILKEYT